MSLLDEYKKQIEADNANINDDLPEGVKLSESERGEYVKYLKELREKTNEDNQKMSEIKRKNNALNDDKKGLEILESLKDNFKTIKVDENSPINNKPAEYKEYKNESLNIINEPVALYVKHAFCPKCGEEIQCKGPSMYNPMTMEAMSMYKCPKCGEVMKLEHSFPRIAFYNKEGKEIKAFSE